METLKIHFLNTIWSDAILLEKEDHFAFIDTGSSFYFPMVKKHLADFQITKLDFIVLTHFHSDHYGNISNILNNYTVDKLYLKHYYGLDGTTASGYSSNDEYIVHEFSMYNEIIESCENNNTEVIYIDEFIENKIDINFNNMPLELYDCENTLYNLFTNKESPVYNKKMFNENYNSIGIFIKYNNFNIFLGGDLSCSNSAIPQIDKRSINIINQIYKNHNINQIDVYKSCHHGGSGTNTKELCDLLKAKYIIITNTDKWLNNYNTIQNLKSANNNAIILKTDYQKYIFTISDKITYHVLKDDSLFITLNKK